MCTCLGPYTQFVLVCLFNMCILWHVLILSVKEIYYK